MKKNVAQEAQAKDEMAFPYEEYLNAIEAESQVRHAGIPAVVTNVEPDENNPGCFFLGVRGTWEDGSLEEGSVSKNANIRSLCLYFRQAFFAYKIIRKHFRKVMR